MNWYPNGAAQLSAISTPAARCAWGPSGDERSGPENAYERLAVAQLTGVGHRQHVLQGQPMNLEDLVLFGARRQRREAGGEEQMNDFCKNAGRRDSLSGVDVGQSLGCEGGKGRAVSYRPHPSGSNSSIRFSLGRISTGEPQKYQSHH